MKLTRIWILISTIIFIINCDINNSVEPNEVLDIKTIKMYDYEYRKNEYFFVDKEFMNNYFDIIDCFPYHCYDPYRIIESLEIYLFDSIATSSPNDKTIYAWAVVDPVTVNNTGYNFENIKGYWYKLPILNYNLDNRLGVIEIWNSNIIKDSTAIAIKYKLSNGEEIGGDSLYALNEELEIIKLIKPKNPNSSDETWDLMLKNTYQFEEIPLLSEINSVVIYYIGDNGIESQLEINGENTSFLTICGLEVFNKSGNYEPNGNIDLNYNYYRPQEKCKWSY